MAGSTAWKVARKKAATWGTSVAVGAGDGVRIMSESLGPGVPEPIKDENVGDSLTRRTLQGDVRIDGNVVIPVRFNGIEKDLGLFMGDDDLTTDQVGQVFTHSLIFQPSNTGLFATWAFDKSVGIHEYPSAKYSSLELGHDGGKLVATFGLIADKVLRDLAAANDATDIGTTATVPSPDHLAIFHQLDFRIAEVTGAEGNLDSGESLKVSDFRLTANRNISGDIVSGSSGTIDEPETDGLPEGQVIITVPNYVAAIDGIVEAAQTAQSGRAPKIYKAQAIYTGVAIESSAPTLEYLFVVELPALTVANAPANAGGPGAKVPVELTFDIVTPQNVPNGSEWTWVVAGGTPFRFRVRNKQASAGV
jgi:hypothetical protein